MQRALRRSQEVPGALHHHCFRVKNILMWEARVAVQAISRIATSSHVRTRASNSRFSVHVRRIHAYILACWIFRAAWWIPSYFYASDASYTSAWDCHRKEPRAAHRKPLIELHRNTVGETGSATYSDRLPSTNTSVADRGRHWSARCLLAAWH